MSDRRHYLLALLDAGIIFIAHWFAIILRFDGQPIGFDYYFNLFIKHLPAVWVITFAMLFSLGIYRIMWRYASLTEYMHVLMASALANAIALIYFGLMKTGMPRSIFPVVFIIETAFFIAIRLSSRQSLKQLGTGPMKVNRDHTASAYSRAMIVGAGDAGALIARELQDHPEMRIAPIVFIDDDPSKKGKDLRGIRVAGGRDVLIETVRTERIDDIILALPSATAKDQQELMELCSQTKARVKILPAYYKTIDDDTITAKDVQKDVRSIQIEDLLGRDPVELDTSQLEGFLKDKIVLVTGAGGSIGSELCRQIIKYKPKKLVMVDNYENNLYELQQEFVRRGIEVPMKVLIDTVRDQERMNAIFQDHKPQIVFHAAAHKHVPLMEDAPVSAIKNNVFGTYNVCKMSDRYKVEKFVLISTDKAVNPTSVMGTTKRICEMVINVWNQRSETDYVGVRFGNVLGSNGSVIPLFRKQIEQGGPVTVTHRDITRYFMTIPEACKLVLQAGAMAQGGELFILDMGQPVKILDLAQRMVKLSGKDVAIEITGLRPGEKLYEELLLDKKINQETSHEMIYIEPAERIDPESFDQDLALLEAATHEKDIPTIRETLKKVVPTYDPYVIGEDDTEAS